MKDRNRRRTWYYPQPDGQYQDESGQKYPDSNGGTYELADWKDGNSDIVAEVLCEGEHVAFIRARQDSPGFKATVAGHTAYKGDYTTFTGEFKEVWQEVMERCHRDGLPRKIRAQKRQREEIRRRQEEEISKVFEGIDLAKRKR